MSHLQAVDSDDESAPDDGVAGLIAKAAELKGIGNDHFKAGETAKAVTPYEDAVKRLTSDVAKKALREFYKSHPDETDTATPLLVSCHTNLAACHVKSQQWESAAAAATAALALDASQVKARFRRGVACSHLGKLDEAKADLTAVVKADPKNKEARTVLETVMNAVIIRREGERDCF